MGTKKECERIIADRTKGKRSDPITNWVRRSWWAIRLDGGLLHEESYFAIQLFRFKLINKCAPAPKELFARIPKKAPWVGYIANEFKKYLFEAGYEFEWEAAPPSDPLADLNRLN